MYHGLGTVPAHQDPDNLFVPVDTFARQVDRLLQRGYHVLGEREFIAWLDGAPTPSRSALLTFDDGLVSVLEDAAPLLAERGLPSIAYVSPGLAGAGPGPDDPPERRLLDDSGMAALADAGVTLGCHSWVHDSMPGMTRSELARATQDAGEAIGAITGQAPRTFAYPFGHHDAAARAAVSESGYDCGFATYDGDGRFALPRVDINATDTPRTFDLKLRRVYPTVRRALSRLPAARRTLHRLVGEADRR
ncbi:polysaccharide deacetylase family protein [Marihabitans asiaticum]